MSGVGATANRTVTGEGVTHADATAAAKTRATAAPPLPEHERALADAFGARLPIAVRYVEWLAGAGVVRGLIGPHETPRLWERHVLNCVAVAALLPINGRVVDIGSGAGLPGLVLAIARPDVSMMLVESTLRRSAFLSEVVSDLGLTNVDVRRTRAEDLRKPRINADIVTARAVASVERLATLSAPLLRLGGQLLALKGSGAEQEVAAAWPALRRTGMVVDAALLAVFMADAANQHTAVSGAPGLRVESRVTWSLDGTASVSTSAATGPHLDPLAVVVRLGRGGHGSHNPASLV
jgi:16S rRNA (guanine527-N7)-methyltransferase